MTAILLGSAGNIPNENGSYTTIPIPTSLPSEPIVLSEGIDPYIPVTGGNIPSGGLSGQVLKKLSDTDFDVDWRNDELSEGDVPEDTTIIRDVDDLISSVVTFSKTTNITRTDGVITSVEDGTYRKDIIRIDGLISSINVTIL